MWNDKLVLINKSFPLICIFSTAIDPSTSEVIKWLHYLGVKDVIRINSNDSLNNFNLQLDIISDKFCFKWEDRLVYLDEIDIVWYRKGNNWLADFFYDITIEGHANFSGYLQNKVKAETSKLAEYIHFVIANTTPVLGSSTKSDLNKLIVLEVARSVGLLIPDFTVTNNKDGLKYLLGLYNEWVTKSLSDGLYLFDSRGNEKGYFSYTELFDKNDIDFLPLRFSPSLLQKQIHKEYELRIFFLENECHTMAIFSQLDNQTRIDYRKYNEERPNRFVPYILPKDIDVKIKALFLALSLNTGSVDMIVDRNDNYYFLEINPVGQFAMVSSPCNYFLEKTIAQYLIKHGKQKTKN